MKPSAAIASAVCGCIVGWLFGAALAWLLFGCAKPVQPTLPKNLLIDYVQHMHERANEVDKCLAVFQGVEP